MQSFDLAAVLRIPELPTYIKRVERAMADVLQTDNQYLHVPISRLLQVRGKRLRPSLVIAAALSQGAKITDDIIAGCVAVELIHISSLVHDDIIDAAVTRWNIPTISSKEGTSAAILVGDYLQAKACAHAATVNAGVAKVAAETIAALCAGQALELTDQNNIYRTEASYLTAIKGKTAALLEASCRIGALCAVLSKPQEQALAQYGHEFGLAFQLIDDVLDFLSTPELSGKPIGNDIREGTYTLPLILSLGISGAKVKNHLQHPTNTTTSTLMDILKKDTSFTKTIALARKYNASAVTSLRHMEHQDNVVGMRQLPTRYLDWALTNLVAPALTEY
jgi:heptaprenyl diphosphate synthase